tara:strand:+ start:78 stop:1160 length:1083 start_codon:yes stop_codon:yes gene_type:complete
MSDVFEFDAVVIGAGIVGLAIAHELSKTYENLLVVDKERSFGQHVSSRNSEIIHSGIYYPKETLKTKLCVEGNKLLYKFLEKYNIPHKKCGKLIVATNEREEQTLEQLYERGIENGISELSVVDANTYEPHIKATKALYVPSTGIIDSHSTMAKLEQLSQENGAIILYNTKISEINKKNNIYELTTKDSDVIIQTNIVINSAGLWSDQVAKLAGIDDYKLHWCKGEYYKTSKHKKMNHLVYPTPDPEGKYLGIHTVLDLDGNLSFGPNAYYVDEIDYKMKEDNKVQFYKAINRYLDINWCDLRPATTGIRPKLQAKGDLFKDFVIKNEPEHKNFINLIGIESPGLTCCLSIAKYVKEIIK